MLFARGKFWRVRLGSFDRRCESVAPLRQGGGNAVNRAREDLAGAMDFMQRKWGHYVRAGKSGDLVLNVGGIKRRQAKV